MGELKDSFSTVRKHALPPAALPALKLVPAQYWNKNFGGQITVQDGTQPCDTLGTILDKPDMDLLNGYGQINAVSGRMAYLGGKASLMITNHGSSTLRFVIYVLSQRRDGASSGQVRFSEGVDDTGGSSTNYTDPGARPTMSAEFRLFKKIEAVVPFALASGQTHVHHLNYDMQRVYNSALSTNTTMAYVKGWTLEYMVSAVGVAAVDTNGANVTTSDGQYNWIISQRHKFKTISELPALTTWTSTLPAKATITTRHYNPDTSAPQDVNTDS